VAVARVAAAVKPYDNAASARKVTRAPAGAVPPAGNAAPATDTVIHPDDGRQVVRAIIRDLIKEKIVTSKDDIVWFGLDNGQFIVNDKHMPDSLLIRFRSKYIRPDGHGYYYGSVKVSGTGTFFTKQELDEH
jgi:hypothetical protein